MDIVAFCFVIFPSTTCPIPIPIDRIHVSLYVYLLADYARLRHFIFARSTALNVTTFLVIITAVPGFLPSTEIYFANLFAPFGGLGVVASCVAMFDILGEAKDVRELKEKRE